MVSEDIERNRDHYCRSCTPHTAKSPGDIVESVTQTQSELLALFESASPDQAQRRPAPDEWSLHELARHAAFTERLIAKLVHHMARGETPSAEDFRGAGIGMMPEDADGSYADTLDELRRMNAVLLDAVRSLPEAPDAEMKLPHPFFGPLTCLEWAGFQRVHDTDHIQHARKNPRRHRLTLAAPATVH